MICCLSKELHFTDDQDQPFVYGLEAGEETVGINISNFMKGRPLFEKGASCLVNKPFGNRVIIVFLLHGINNPFDWIIECHDGENNEKGNTDQNKREHEGDANQQPENGMKENGLQR